MSAEGSLLANFTGSLPVRRRMGAYEAALEETDRCPQEEFRRLVAAAIEWVRRELDSDRSNYYWHDSEFRHEDGISSAVAGQLKAMLVGLLRVDKQFHCNGSVDIAVSDERFALVALAEAKVFADNSKLHDGVRQLVTRYWTSSVTMALLLIYNGKPSVTERMEGWCVFLKGQDSQSPYTCAEVESARESWWVAQVRPRSHTGSETGDTVTVYQVLFDGWIDPLDKSGTDAKVHQQRRRAIQEVKGEVLG